jgi:hypothetical protein
MGELEKCGKAVVGGKGYGEMGKKRWPDTPIGPVKKKG